MKTEAFPYLEALCFRNTFSAQRLDYMGWGGGLRFNLGLRRTSTMRISHMRPLILSNPTGCKCVCEGHVGFGVSTNASHLSLHKGLGFQAFILICWASGMHP